MTAMKERRISFFIALHLLDTFAVIISRSEAHSTPVCEETVIDGDSLPPGAVQNG
jgi:hypothetical protein